MCLLLPILSPPLTNCEQSCWHMEIQTATRTIALPHGLADNVTRSCIDGTASNSRSSLTWQRNQFISLTLFISSRPPVNNELVYWRMRDTKPWLHCCCSLRHTHTRLTAPFPGQPGWAGTRKVKPIWILLKQETVSGSGISWAICKSAPCSRQITTPAPHHSVFYRPDALPAAQPTASKHWRPTGLYGNQEQTTSVARKTSLIVKTSSFAHRKRQSKAGHVVTSIHIIRQLACIHGWKRNIFHPGTYVSMISTLI